MTTYYYTKCEYPSKIYDDYENYRIEYTYYSWMQHNYYRDNCIRINISLTLSPLLDIYSSPAHPTSPLQNKIELKIKMKWNQIHSPRILQHWWQHRDHRHHRLRHSWNVGGHSHRQTTKKGRPPYFRPRLLRVRHIRKGRVASNFPGEWDGNGGQFDPEAWAGIGEHPL